LNLPGLLKNTNSFLLLVNSLYLKNQVQEKMTNTQKKRALTPTFVSQNQLVLEGFESPFNKKLNPENRWVVLAKN
jgi:hypothetical protein